MLGEAGGICYADDQVIRYQPTCAEAIEKLHISKKQNFWTGLDSDIPSGCSITIDTEMHFEQSLLGVGSSKDDLIPICQGRVGILHYFHILFSQLTRYSILYLFYKNKYKSSKTAEDSVFFFST